MTPNKVFKLCASKFIAPDNSVVVIPEGSWAIQEATIDSGVLKLKAASIDNAINAVRFNTAGTRMFLLGNTFNKVYQFDLTVPWELSSAVYNNGFYQMASSTVNVQSMDFKSDGTRMIILSVNASERNFYYYSLSTPWDVTTATPIGTKAWDSGIGASGEIVGLRVAAANNKFFVSVSNNTGFTNQNRIWTVNITSLDAWNPSAGWSKQAYDYVFGTFTDPRDLDFSADGTKMFVASRGAGAIAGYNLGTAWTLASGAQTYQAAYNKSTSNDDALISTLEYNPTGTRLYVAGTQKNTVAQYNMQTPWNASTAIAAPPMPLIMQETDSKGIEISADGRYMYIIGDVRKTVEVYTLSTPFVLPSATSTTSWDKAFSFSVQAIRFIPDGTKMFVANGDTNEIWRFSVPTPFRPSTIVGQTPDQILAVSQDSSIRGIAITSNGTSLYVVGNTNRLLHRFSMSTAFSLASATFASSSPSALTTSVSGIACSSDGRFFAVSNSTGGILDFYGTSTASDLASLVHLGSYTPAVETQPTDIAITQDGHRMFICGTTTSQVHSFISELIQDESGRPSVSNILTEPGYAIVPSRQLLGTFTQPPSKWAVIGTEKTSGDIFIYDGNVTIRRKQLLVTNEAASADPVNTAQTFTYSPASNPISFVRSSHTGSFLLAKTQTGLWSVASNASSKYSKLVPSSINIIGLYVKPGNSNIFRLAEVTENSITTTRLTATRTPASSAYTASTAVGIIDHPVVSNAQIDIPGYQTQDFVFSPNGTKLILQVKEVATGNLSLFSYDLAVAWQYNTVGV